MKAGDTVRLKGRRKTAVVQKVRADGGVLLTKRLADFQWWNVDDLEVVKGRDAAHGRLPEEKS